MSTAKEEGASGSLIKDAIDASIKFEELMDSIDFNSYLAEKIETKEVKRTSHYRTYQNMVKIAEGIINDVLRKAVNDEIIKQLFEAKRDRLEARKLTERKEEIEKYIDAANKLNNGYIHIDPRDLKGNAGRSIYNKSNWAKVLLYNEMAICYSGLAESSISLGYAERSKSLLKKIHKKIGKSLRKELQDNKLLLYTFALFNKGEAERLLHNYDQSLKTFQEIIKIYENKNTWSKGKPSDYYSALIRIALILIDMGRGEEAIEYLKKVKALKKVKSPSISDYRIQDRDLEEARALIDMKEYKEALLIFDRYRGKDWEFTFTQRKAKVNELRLVIEFIKNRSKDFLREEDEISKKIRHKYNEFKKTTKDLLYDSVEKRRDADNFKRTCISRADYFHELKERSKTQDEIQKYRENELRSYYLFICHKIIFETKKNFLEKKEITPEDIINDWISKKDVNLNDLIKAYEGDKNLINFSKEIEKINDEHYLKGFFETYIDFDPNNGDTLQTDKEDYIIKALQKRLIHLFREKDNLTEAARVEELFSIYKEKRSGDSGNNKENSLKFIQECFFKGVFFSGDNKQTTCLTPDSILNKMQQNTKDFTTKVVRKTKRFPKDREFRGIFTVLRRWNSFTPTLTSSINPSKGGGYFFYFSYNNEPLGIVLDPGYDFLENLLSSGFRIGDINAVIISHAHPDHTDNLPSILSLFHEANGRLGKYHHESEFNKKHLKLILSQGVFDQYYSGFIKPSQESLKDIIVVKSDSGNPCYDFSFKEDNYAIEIEAFPTFHGDIMKKWESLGFIIKIKKDKDPNPIRKIGYTSDAHWKEEFCDRFKDCNIVCAHLGSIIDILGEKEFCSLCGNYKEDTNPRNKKCKEYPNCKSEKFKNGEPSMAKLIGQAREQKHLYLSGLTMLFDELLSSSENGNDKLAVISEFGEELKGGIRMDLYHKFDDWFQESSKGNARCIPGDIGLEIDIMNNNIFCSCCQEFKSKDRIAPITYGKEEAIFYVCDECNSVLSSYQIEEKLKDYYENGRTLELADD